MQDYTEEYDKICEAFASMIESLPRVEIYTNAFPGSSLLHTSVHDIFVSCLHFWMQACKFYRRKRLFNLLRATWNNYEIEFSRLESAMKSALDRVERGGIAEHIKEAKSFRQEQQMLAEQASNLQKSKDLADIIRKLSPSTGDVNYFLYDHDSIRKLRHPGTCGWIFENDVFNRWSSAPAVSGWPDSLLWINGGPGMGKTVLSSAIIDYLQSPSASAQRPTLVFFYFKGTSSDNDNPTSAILSFLYQILVQNKDDLNIRPKMAEIINSARNSLDVGLNSLW